MKRLGHVFDAVIDRENLAAAFSRVCKGRRRRRDVVRFAANVEENLNDLHRALADGSFRFGDYNFFRISHPKPRTIAAASIRERIVHHAIIAVIGDRLERSLIDKSCACRRGKGQWAAVAEARSLAGKHPWCLKLDVKNFFDSIDHGILLRLLCRKIKDKRTMALLRQLVASHETSPGRGLPIGNLTSQYFANLYLDPLDRMIDGRKLAHVRYMDDLVVFGGHDELKALFHDVPAFLADALKLELNAKGGLHRTARGVDFLGARIFPDRTMLASRSKSRFRAKVARLDAALAAGLIGERRYQTRMTQLFAFVKNCESAAFRRKVISEDGHRGLPPRARRMLERQQQRRLCRRVPLRVPQQQLRQQQQHPGAGQQLLGLPRVLSSRSSRELSETRLNRPFSGTVVSAVKHRQCLAVPVDLAPNATRGFFNFERA